MEAFIRAMPKAELHLHIEGTLEPEMMLELAERNGVTLPFGSVEEVRAAYEFDSLQSFLDVYYEGARVLLTERDFHDLMRAYLERVHGENVRHAEIFFDPQTHTSRGVSFEAIVNGLHAAIGEARDRLGISATLILCFLRHLPEGEAHEILERARHFREWITGVGLDSSEIGNPPEKFADVFARARAEGFRAVAHAGEEGPVEYIRGALDVLGVERIDHGVRCEEDDGLVDRLAREGIPLTMCPLSNVKLRVFDSLKQHNLKRLLDRGVKVTVNSDDPAYFGGYVTANLVASSEALGLDREDLHALMRNSFEASFLADDDRARLLKELDGFVASWDGGDPPS